MTEQFQFSEGLKRIFITKDEHDSLQADLYRSDALADKRYSELNTKVTSTSDPEEILFLKRLKVCLGLIANCN